MVDEATSSSDDRYADYRPQALSHPFRLVGWIMLGRGLITAGFAFPVLASFASSIQEGRYADAVALLSLGVFFVTWGGKSISSGAAIALRFKVKPGAPSDLSERLDPHTSEMISYGRRAYKAADLRYLFLRKEIPDQAKTDLVDEILSLLGRSSEPMHPLKRALIIDVLRGAVASLGLLIAFISSFVFVLFDPMMHGQISLMNFVFFVAFLMALKNWGLTKEAWIQRHAFSIPRLFQQAGGIFLVAVLLPVLLNAFGSISTVLVRIQVPSPFFLLMFLIVLGGLATALVLAVPVIQSRKPVYNGPATLAISDGPPIEMRGRLLAKDLLNAFARHIAASRTLSLDDRVYSFSETLGKSRGAEQSDHAEFIAESAPLIRPDQLATSELKRILLTSSIFGEILLAGCALLLLATSSDLLDVVRHVASLLHTANFGGLMVLTAHPLFTSALLLLAIFRFGILFREIGLRFLAEVIFQSYIIVITISSSVMAGRNEAEINQSEGSHLFDGGQTSILRIRIQTAFVHTVTMVVTGVGGDSLADPRYIIGAEREDRLTRWLANEAYRYVKERTDTAVTRVRGQTVAMEDARNILVDSGSGAQLVDRTHRATLGSHSNVGQFLADRHGAELSDSGES